MLRRCSRAGAVTIAVLAAGVWGQGSAQAGASTNLEVFLSVRAADALAVINDITVEVYEPGSPPTLADPAPTCAEDPPTGSGTDVDRDDTCSNLSPGAYILGLAGVPEGMPVAVECISADPPQVVNDIGTQAVLDDPGAAFDTTWGAAQCFVDIGGSLVVVDKDVFGGPADPPDFTHDVTQGDTVLGSGVDPDVDTYCGPAFADCAVINVAPDFGEGAEAIALTETPPPGYMVDEVQCVEYYRIDDAGLNGSGIPEEDLPFVVDGTDLDLSIDGPSDAYCVVRNVWIGGTLDVDVSVVNDNGGTGTPADVTIEIYDSTETLISSHPCPADGSCVVNAMLPPGDYTLGYTGLPTYTDSWTQATTPPMIPTAIDTQAIITDDPDAAFTIVTGGLVEIDGVFDDPVPATTTTTSTTTTTIVPATTTTTTIAIPIAPTLPETGASAAANARMAMVAVGLIAAGGALVIAVSRRRTA